MGGPNLILLAGPNGAGKTTASSDLLAGALNIHHFVNADEITLTLGGEHPAMAAGRIMLERLRDLTAQRTNVAFETTLASRSFAPWIRRLKDSGYSFNLFYFWLPTPEVAIERVRVRKLLGGHSVPEVAAGFRLGVLRQATSPWSSCATAKSSTSTRATSPSLTTS